MRGSKTVAMRVGRAGLAVTILGALLVALSLGPRGVTVTLRNGTGEQLAPVRVFSIGDAASTDWIETEGIRSVTLCPVSDSSIWVAFGVPAAGSERVLDLGCYVFSGAIGSVDATIFGPVRSGPSIGDVAQSQLSYPSVWNLLPQSASARGFGAGAGAVLLLVGLARLVRRRRPADGRAGTVS